MRYEKPVMEIVELDVEDVITTSIPTQPDGQGGILDGNNWPRQ